MQQLYITDVKAGGLAFAKGLLPFIFIKLTLFIVSALMTKKKTICGALAILYKWYKTSAFFSQGQHAYLQFPFKNALAHV